MITLKLENKNRTNWWQQCHWTDVAKRQNGAENRGRWSEVVRVYNKTERETDRKTEEVEGRLSLDEEMSSNQNKKKSILSYKKERNE